MLEKIKTKIDTNNELLKQVRALMVEPKKRLEELEAERYSVELEVIRYDDRIRNITAENSKLIEIRDFLEKEGWVND